MPSHIDRRLAETAEPFRSGAMRLATGMRSELMRENADGRPAVVLFVERVKTTWPSLRLSANIKAVAGMVVAAVFAPQQVPGRRKSAARGSVMASGTLFVPAPDASNIDSAESAGATFHLAREALERAAETFGTVKAGGVFDSKRVGHLRLAVRALQLANAGPPL